MNYLGKSIFFVAYTNSRKESVNWYAVDDDGQVFMNATCNTLVELERVSPFLASGMTRTIMMSNIARILKQRRQANVTDAHALNRDVIYKEIVNDHLVAITSPPTFRLNCTEMKPSSRLKPNLQTGELNIVHYKDVIVKYDPSVIIEDKTIQAFYDQLENGDYLLYYLNEFRHNQKLPALLLAGDGGSGKSTVLKSYTAYKVPCTTFFKRDSNTGNFGDTSLVLCEEADKSSCGNLTLNLVKDAITTERHNIRKLYCDNTQVVGNITILFSANNNKHSLVLNLYNQKGEDAVSVKRRTSTFNFTDTNALYMTTNGCGKYLNEKILECPLADGRRSTLIDAHLNYLESIHYFDNPKFIKGELLLVVVHSPNVVVCTRLSIRSGVILERLYSASKDYPVGSKIKCVRSGDVLAAFSYERGKIPSRKGIMNDLEDICPGCFHVGHSNTDHVLTLIDKDKLSKMYFDHMGKIEDIIDYPNSPEIIG